MMFEQGFNYINLGVASDGASPKLALIGEFLKQFFYSNPEENWRCGLKLRDRHEERGFTSPQSRLTVADRNFCGVPVNPTMRLNVMTRGLRTTRSL